MFKNLFIISIIVLNIGCSGGGGDSQSSSTNTSLTKAGVLIDSPVENIFYDTLSQSGVTNSNGEFSYLDGETVTFSIGTLVFPAVAAQGVITPLTLANASSVTDQQATNIARLLQSLDEDGDSLNGIVIPSGAASIARPIDFNVDTITFENNPTVINLIANSGSITTSLISVVEAQAHVTQTLFNEGILTGGNEGTLGAPVEITPEISRLSTISALSIQPFVVGQSFYKFKVPSDGLYTIGITNTSTVSLDLDWSLFLIGTQNSILECKNDILRGNEICQTPQLSISEEYLLHVGNNSQLAGSFDILVTQGEILVPIEGNEGSISDPLPLVIGFTHKGSVAANGGSFYIFSSIDNSSHAIDLRNITPIGVNLDWSIFTLNNELLMECKNDVPSGGEFCLTQTLLPGTYKIFVNSVLSEPANFDLAINF